MTLVNKRTVGMGKRTVRDEREKAIHSFVFWRNHTLAFDYVAIRIGGMLNFCFN